MYAGQATAATVQPTDTSIEEETADQTAPAQEPSLLVAQIHNDLPFGEAFETARAEVGPGGVFIWHGGIYSTYTEEEWNAMTAEQKNDFALQVNPEINASETPTPTDAQPDVATLTADVPEAQTALTDDVQIADNQASESIEQDSDVHFVGFAEVEGHLVAGYDTNGDNEVDVAIIDVDDTGTPSAQDVIVDSAGHAATLGGILDEPSDTYYANMDNPDVAPDMPDYMNDAYTDDMNYMA